MQSNTANPEPNQEPLAEAAAAEPDANDMVVVGDVSGDTQGGPGGFFLDAGVGYTYFPFR